jgi:hypothetical protein
MKLVHLLSVHRFHGAIQIHSKLRRHLATQASSVQHIGYQEVRDSVTVGMKAFGRI